MGPLLLLSGGVFLGWTLGANDAANVFGAAVASRIITFRRAAALCSAAVLAGAYWQGQAGMDTYRGLIAEQELVVLLVTALAAGVTAVTAAMMT